jgi:hypothetical protein
MRGRDGTGPMVHGPMTGGRGGFRGDAALSPGRGGGRGPRNQFDATGLSGWQRAAQADAQATAPMGGAPDPLARIEEMRLDPPGPKMLPAGVEVIDTTSTSPPSPAITLGSGTDTRPRVGRRRRFELARFPFYHEHMLITSEEPDATSTY